MRLSWIFVMLLLAFVALFSVQNAEVVTVRFLVWQFSLSAALVIQLAAFLGAVVGLMIGALSGRESRKAARRLRSAPAEAMLSHGGASPRVDVLSSQPTLPKSSE